MVALNLVRKSNSEIKASKVAHLVAVFVGATSGIGESSLKQLAVNAAKPTIYLVGRSETAAERIIEECKELNPDATVNFIKSDVALLKNVDTVCAEIKKNEEELNLLFLSPGYLSFAGRQENAEGLDNLFSLRYYARLRFVQNLLPLLSKPSTARVISILSGGKEGKLVESDLSLKDNYGILNCAIHSGTMTTLSFEHLAAENPSISFLHVYPGLVKTNVFNSPHFGFIANFIINWIVLPLAGPFSVAVAECGARNVFLATSRRYPPAAPIAHDAMVTMPAGMETALSPNGEKGKGVYAVDWNSETISNSKILKGYRESGMDRKVWEHTVGEFERIRGGN